MSTLKKISLLFIILILSSCGSGKSKVKKGSSAQPKKELVRNKRTSVATTKRSAANQKSETETSRSEVLVSTSKTTVTNEIVNAYIDQFSPIAKENMSKYGIPASIILAQGILESGSGLGTLSKNANNHFGIKCHTGWEGESVRHDDDSAQECFRKYTDPGESYKDHALFLTGRSRYAALFKLKKDDYEGWAKGLRAAGYATDPKYPEKLIGLIQRYQLQKYDMQVMGKTYKEEPVVVKTETKTTTIITSTPEIASNDTTYRVQQGDTLYSISKKFNTTVEELKKKNNLSDNSIAIGQNLKI